MFVNMSLEYLAGGMITQLKGISHKGKIVNMALGQNKAMGHTNPQRMLTLISVKE